MGTVIRSIPNIPIFSWPHPRWALGPSEMGKELGGDGGTDPEYPNPFLASPQMGFDPVVKWEMGKEMGTAMLRVLSIPILSCLAKQGFPHGRGSLGAGLGLPPRSLGESSGTNKIPGGSFPIINGSKLREVSDKRRCFNVLTKAPCASGTLHE